MLKGIDISNWQSTIKLSALDIDFAIFKATEGLYFKDPTMVGFVKQAKNKGIKYGFYHFARNNDPIKEANFFYKTVKNYLGQGIMCMDIEDNSIRDWGKYASEFSKEFHRLSGVYPLLYTSAGFLYRYADYPDVWKNCGLWLAGYPRTYTTWTKDSIPYKTSPWQTYAIWQFTGQGRIKGYSSNLDLDYANMDRTAWDKYAKGDGKKTTKKSIEEIAYEVIRGKWGVGNDRKQRLQASGYSYSKVQARVNEIMKGMK